MKVLLIYRNKKLGYSIGKVFNSIESELKSTCDVESRSEERRVGKEC